MRPTSFVETRVHDQHPQFVEVQIPAVTLRQAFVSPSHAAGMPDDEERWIRHCKGPEFHFIELLRAGVISTAIQGVGIRQRTLGSLCTLNQLPSFSFPQLIIGIYGAGR